MATHECDVCGANVLELRRGRCWGCYARWVDARPVGLGARCVVCNERRRRLLRSTELHGSWYPTCYSCAGQAMQLDPQPQTIAELKAILRRDRRSADRRAGKPDTRVFQWERRVGDRRLGRLDECPSIDDDMIIEITVEEETSFEDQTRIRELVA
ncbi:MAG: hypothetical protein F9K40_16760 [Kofleriaceae bacterium]|nr:MAG: hypothetical protein F9K40_16760 [Kofleriaceae bacterium]MBZ0238752.1 hypothetical protein [Kofleriaceae bacterium]